MQHPQPFDFTRAMRRLCEDIADRMEPFAHIRMDEVAVAFAQARRRTTHGLQAKLTPMRFESGATITVRSGRRWTVQRLHCDGREMLYILTFYLPRFQNQTFREKMITVFHELYHISPHFDGDIRRLSGRYHVHSHAQDEYDRQMAVYAEQYLRRRPSESLYAFLQMDFGALQRQFGAVMGTQVPIPRLIPLDDLRTA